MNPQQLKSLGVLLGIIVLIVLSIRFYFSIGAGNPNWYYLVMICGMGLLLFYTLWGTVFKRK